MRTALVSMVRALGRLRWCRALGSARAYHDHSFGYRTAREFNLPDYTPSQLENRALNAPLLRYVDSVRTHGHRAALIDPLDILQRDQVAALNPRRYGLVDDTKRFNVEGIFWADPIDPSASTEDWWTLDEITRHLHSIYVGRIAYEYMHSTSKTERLWFQRHLERPMLDIQILSEEEKAGKKRIHELLAYSETFDSFLQLKFPNLKRYGLEGGESMLPALDTLFSISCQAGIQHIVLAMPHRGRLNVLANLLGYSPRAIFHKIKGGSEVPEDLGAEGDVLSHLAASPVLSYNGAHDPLKVSLLPNPSHLEAVNPIALGKTRAKQYALLKTSPSECKLGDRVMCVQLHGDASFTGQGIVMETLGLSNLPHFTSGGSVHIVVDNRFVQLRVGYTTPASAARSSPYCSDIGKMIHAPILHVNGDYPEDVARAVKTAFEYRQHFRKDIIIDLLVYRRWGHNELDEPSFTQPLMYQKIRSRQSVPQRYENHLITDNIIPSIHAQALRASYKSHLESELSSAASYVPTASMCQGQWVGMVWPASVDAVWDPGTGVDEGTLRKVGEASVGVPNDFEIHPRLQRHIDRRIQCVASGEGIDWATAEAMAFGSLMLEGYDVRISGQDVGRGTFSHRHAMFVDQKTERITVPLNTALQASGKLELANSSLSELGVLGFEYGASWERPSILPIWEAQFGDFFNGAQVIIDTFIASSETRWLRQSGIVLNLPHGLDGAGPDHSSSRIERFLQLSNDRYSIAEADRLGHVNMNVTYPTTPAQYFHLLRRQMKRNFRKPLVVAGPKGLLRLAVASSELKDFAPSTRFRPVFDDPSISTPSQVTRIILLTGKLYYPLLQLRQTAQHSSSVAFIRIEELSPFPFHELQKVIQRYENAKEVVWMQEEPRNQGALPHVGSRIQTVLDEMGHGHGKLVEWCRSESPMSATGVGKFYAKEQGELVARAFQGL